MLVAVKRRPGSLYFKIPEGAKNKTETMWEAQAGLGDDLGVAERSFFRERKTNMRNSFTNSTDMKMNKTLSGDIASVTIASNTKHSSIKKRRNSVLPIPLYRQVNHYSHILSTIFYFNFILPSIFWILSTKLSSIGSNLPAPLQSTTPLGLDFLQIYTRLVDLRPYIYTLTLQRSNETLIAEF